MSPSISVIVPIYKTEKYILKCLNSIQSQTYTDIEIICVDDASSDRSVDIVEQCKALDPRIKLIRHHTNLGLSAARNTGIDIAEGQFIASVDSDDFISADFLEKLYGAALENDCDIVACGLNEVDNKGRLVRSIKFGEHLVDFAKVRPNLFSLTNPSFCTKLWRTSFLRDNQLRFEIGRYYEDLIFTYKALMLPSKFCSINDLLYFYLQRDDSIIKTYSEKHILDYIYAFDALKHSLHENNLYSSCRNFFNQMINDNFDYFSSNLLEAISNDHRDVRDINRYLRIIMHLKISYILYDDDLFYDQPFMLVEKVKSRDTPDYLRQIASNNKILMDLKYLTNMPEAKINFDKGFVKYLIPGRYKKALEIFRRRA